ncbi:DUF938 domain-containing protein [uncultured Algimonas sp.]|uniref:DUF938 domain-containing protein n=1 Tax=uncultured Algimonas sp. TaxID=1547920 RepID=UPI00262374A1|nr:DUF938 domain-containing protein [uncultured Algimonas sp.]
MTDKPIALENRAQEGNRLFSPSAGRNKAVIADWLAAQLPPAARVLEAGSGTGEHGAALGERRPDITWQYSDPDAASRASQEAWAREGWPKPLALDLAQEAWWSGLGRFDAVFCANMIHIAPIEAAQGLAAGAAQLTDTVMLYGPFLFGGDSAPSNLEFDASLKRRDPRWGVREWESVKHIFRNAGFNRAERHDMPRNNHIVRLSRH